MHREYHRWFSPSLQRDMELLTFGHAGARVLVFPTSQGRFWDWEERGMISSFSGEIEQGWLQFYCVDSVDSESWYAYWKHPADRLRRHEAYDRYIDSEVMPLTRKRNPNPFMILTGASFGAYHAINFAFRHPEVVGRVIGLSGLYDLRRFTDGYYDESLYFNNPVDYLANEHDAARLDALRRMDIIFAIGRDDPLRWSNDRLSQILHDKGIHHAYRIWDGWQHDWPYWKAMLRQYISGSD